MHRIGHGVFWVYYYTFMDRMMFDKRFAISSVTQDDNKLSKDLRLLNYIETAIKNGEVEESYLYATQTSDRVKPQLKEFIEL